MKIAIYVMTFLIFVLIGLNLRVFGAFLGCTDNSKVMASAVNKQTRNVQRSAVINNNSRVLAIGDWLYNKKCVKKEGF